MDKYIVELQDFQGFHTISSTLQNALKIAGWLITKMPVGTP